MKHLDAAPSHQKAIFRGCSAIFNFMLQQMPTFAVVYAVLELPTISPIFDILAFLEGKWNFSGYILEQRIFRNWQPLS